MVLSNNDGCIVALSNEAKSLGLHRGDPHFKVASLCRRHGVRVLSGNHRLYGDMSSRVMAILGASVPDIETYSIDEAFICFGDGDNYDDIVGIGHEFVRRIRRCTGIPTSLGIAPTRTLAKVAAHFAKKYPGYHSVCSIDDERSRRKALELTDVADVWGVGRRMAPRLNVIGIDNALQLADFDGQKIAANFNISLQRTWRELNGIPCISRDTDDSERKSMCCTRSFGEMLTTYAQLHEAVSLFASILGRKLRKHRLAAVSLTVFVHTSSYRTDLDQYCNSSTRRLDEASSDTMAITAAAVECLKTVFRKGYAYKKAGIIIGEIVSEEAVCRSLFTDGTRRARNSRLMAVVDGINSSSTMPDMVHFAAHTRMESLVRVEHRSPLYSSRLKDIITVNTPKIRI